MKGVPNLSLLKTIFYFFLSGFYSIISVPIFAQTSVEKAFIQGILDSVSISRIYQTVEHLSGEKPFRIDGQWDSIMTRYSNSPHIYKTQQYLQSRFEQMGYEVDLFPFKGTVDYLAIQFAPGQKEIAWLSGTDGKIFGTMDEGNTWTIQYISDHSIYESIYAWDEVTAWAVGRGGAILKTEDGVNWSPKSSPTDLSLFDTFFQDEQTGWICGDQGLVLKTSDGGINWEIKNTPTANSLYDLYFYDDLEGWALGYNGTIIHTSDGGETWSLQNTGTDSFLHGVYFLTPDKGFAVGSMGTVLKTTNGGTDWIILMESSTGDFYHDIDFVDQDNGIIAGISGICLKTIDGGNSWTQMGRVLNWWLNDIDMLDTHTLWACGGKMVACSNYSGESWDPKVQNIPQKTLNNLYATKAGFLYPDDYWIICAHYDAMSKVPLSLTPGADDNASGTATVIEAAKVLNDYGFPYSIRFVLFAGEEQGLVGSWVQARTSVALEEKIHGIINLDMIGYDGDGDGRMGIHSGWTERSRELGNKIRSNIETWDLPLNPMVLTDESSTGSDHASFWRFGYPAVLIIEDRSEKNPYYHTVQDRLATIRSSYFHAMARLAIGSIAHLAGDEAFWPPFLPDPLLGGIEIPQENTNHGVIVYSSFPNPFSEMLNIHYSLSISSEVRIGIYNLLGNMVEQLVSDYQEPGEYSIRWQPGNLPSGLYYLFLQAMDQVQTEKLVLVR